MCTLIYHNYAVCTYVALRSLYCTWGHLLILSLWEFLLYIRVHVKRTVTYMSSSSRSAAPHAAPHENFLVTLCLGGNTIGGDKTHLYSEYTSTINTLKALLYCSNLPPWLDRVTVVLYCVIILIDVRTSVTSIIKKINWLATFDLS